MNLELGACLDIIKILNKNDFELAKQTLSDQDHSGMSHSLVCSMIIAFCDEGQKFIDYIKEI